MSGAGGQASVEYAGLLGVALVIGGALALIAGPPLAGAVRDALAEALSTASPSQSAVVVTAADIADVQSALRPSGEAVTPDAAMLALARRHGPHESVAIADALLLEAARQVAPWIAMPRTYRAWKRASDGPYMPTTADAGSDRDVESVTGPPLVRWITVGGQRRALEAALAHHTKPGAVALDLLGAIPFSKVPMLAGVAGARALVRLAAKRLPDGIDALQGASSIDQLVPADAGGVPAGMRAGDLVVAWPVLRTFWRGDRQSGVRYEHRVVLRPGVRGLAVIAEGLRT